MEPVPMLRLLQLFDSQFPVGTFAHSGGLETYAASGGGLPELRSVLEAQVALGWGRGDLAAACLAWHAASDADLQALAHRVDALKVVPMMRNSSVRLGRRTLTLLRRLHAHALATFAIDPPHHAVIVGAVGRRIDIEVTPLLLAYAQSLATGTLAAATRCMPVSPVQTQELLTELQPGLAAAVSRVLHDPEACLFTSTPALDIRAHQQAYLRTRLFQS